MLFRSWKAVILLNDHLMQGEAVYIVFFYHMVAIRMCNKSHIYISHKSYQFCITKKLRHSHENSPNKKNS